jgi:hypothetical protein
MTFQFILALLLLASVGIDGFLQPFRGSLTRHGIQGNTLSSRSKLANNYNNHKESTLKMADSSKISNWDFLDGIYLITTSNGDDRVAKTRSQLEKVGMWGEYNVQVRTFETDDEDRVRGCYTSHMKVLTDVQKSMVGKSNYKVLILEDNLEITARMSPDVVQNVDNFLKSMSNGGQWDVFHLAYMMYVPGLFLKKMDTDKQGITENIVQMFTDESSAVGTSAYIVSKSGVESMLSNDAAFGFREAVPNVMARLFPETRYAAYPMVFHRAAKVGSLVNPQLDTFRQVMFTPAMYTTWEKLMVGTGLQNNQLFPGLMISLFSTAIAFLIDKFVLHQGTDYGSLQPVVDALPQILVGLPLAVAIWGATLFTPGVTNKGYSGGDLEKAGQKG